MNQSSKSLSDPSITAKPSKEYKDLFATSRNTLSKYLLPIVLVLIVSAFSVIFLCRIYHLLVPSGWSWLTNDQINIIDKFLFSGTIGTIVGSTFRGLIVREKY